MYHQIVARKIRSIFASISGGDYEPMLKALAPEFVYRFEGDTSIGGERRTLPAMRAWWERMYRLFPSLSFDVRDVIVNGSPWNTRAATYLKFRTPLPDGRVYENDVVQIVHLRWGRVTYVHTIEDSLRCAQKLQLLAQRGVEEALAPAIRDDMFVAGAA